MNRPNIIIIITHDTGRHLGCYDRGVETPSFDRMTEEGVLFTNAFCTAPQCSPSRGSLITGMYPHSNGLVGLTHRKFDLKPNVPLMPELFNNAGYNTYLFGLQHESREAEKLGYQHIFQENIRPYKCKDVTPLVLDFLKHNPRQPFLAMAGFWEVHRPYLEPTEKSVENVKVPAFLEDVPDIRRDVERMNVMVRDVDNCVGQIIKEVDENGLGDNTIIIFTTDHGTPFPGAKMTLFDPGIEISLIMRCPDILGTGKKINGLVSNVDVLPTLLDVCGVEIPAKIQGRSVLTLIEGKTEEVNREIFCETNYHVAYDPARAVRTKKYKYIRSYEERTWWVPPNVDNYMGTPELSKEWYRKNRPEFFTMKRPAELLYDLEKDPLERKSRADDAEYKEIMETMRRGLRKWQEETNDPILKGTFPAPEGAILTSLDEWYSK